MNHDQLKNEFDTLLALADADEAERVAHWRILRSVTEEERDALRDVVGEYMRNGLKRHARLEISDSELSTLRARVQEMLMMVGPPPDVEGSLRDAYAKAQDSAHEVVEEFKREADKSKGLPEGEA